VLYLDTSALVKRYVQESGSDNLRQLLQREQAAGKLAFTSVLTFAEVHAALVQRRKDKSLTKRKFEMCQGSFDADWSVALSPIALDAEILLIVRDVVGLGLKGADAVHLASAIWLANTAPDNERGNIIFATSDKRLSRAATARKLSVFIP
jgi:uncharacterized protein